jgi:hypothetical protein
MFGPLSRLMILSAAASGMVLTTLPSTAALPPSENVQLSATNAQNRNNRCMGYGNLEPDHVVEIQGKMSTVTFQVKTQQPQDTTLVIQGPNNVVYCSADAADGSKNTALTIDNFKEGTYKVWVGALDSGTTFRYNLSVHGQ